MDYPNVKNAHIVPQMYLSNWAVAGMIGVRLVRERLQKVLAVESVGTRRRFYRRQRPDGTEIDDVEWSLGQGESKAAPLLRSFHENWPLRGGEKAMLAELFAYQLLRGPRWKAEYEERTRRFLDEYDDANERDLTAEEREKLNAHFLEDSRRLIMMFGTALTLASILGSMHWVLVVFDSPLIATSDHPVVAWPGADNRRPEAPMISQAGVLECLEFRLPLSPTHAVLMTWADWPDDEHILIGGKRYHAANFNAFTVAAADRQWFHFPGTSPPVGTGKLLPLSVELVPSYSPLAAVRSQRRKRASEHAQKKVGRDLHDRDIEIVTVSR
jgi:hypothetical protein